MGAAKRYLSRRFLFYDFAEPTGSVFYNYYSRAPLKDLSEAADDKLLLLTTASFFVYLLNVCMYAALVAKSSGPFSLNRCTIRYFEALLKRCPRAEPFLEPTT